MLPNSLYELDGEAKKLDAQSHKLEVNNSVVSVQTVLCVHCTICVIVFYCIINWSNLLQVNSTPVPTTRPLFAPY